VSVDDVQLDPAVYSTPRDQWRDVASRSVIGSRSLSHESADPPPLLSLDRAYISETSEAQPVFWSQVRAPFSFPSLLLFSLHGESFRFGG